MGVVAGSSVALASIHVPVAPVFDGAAGVQATTRTARSPVLWMRMSTPLGQDETQQQREDETHDAHDGLRDGPRLERLRYTHVEEFLDEPEAGVVHVRQHERACS